MAQILPDSDGGPDEPDRGPLDAILMGLPDQWTLLRDRRLGGIAVGSVLLHPEIGMALLDLAPADPGAAVPALRALLDRERFAAYYPGELPIIARAVAADEVETIGDVLAAGFEAEPPLEIADPDWTDAIVELLLRPAEADAPPLIDEPPMVAAPALRAPRRDAMPPSRPRRSKTPALLTLLLLCAVGGAATAAWLMPLPAALQRDHSTARDRSTAIVNLPVPPLAAQTPAPPSTATAWAQKPNRPAPRSLPPLIAAKTLHPPPRSLALAPIPELPHPAPVIAAASPPIPLPEAKPTGLPEPKPSVLPEPKPSDTWSQPVIPAPLPEAKGAEAVAAPLPPKVRTARPRIAQSPKPPKPPRAVAALAPHSGPPIDAADLPPETQSGSTMPPPARHDPTTDEAMLGGPAPRAAPTQPAPLFPASDGPPTRLLAPPPPARTEQQAGGAPVEQRNCRPYVAESSLAGAGQTVRGVACRGSDGQWHVVSEVPAAR